MLDRLILWLGREGWIGLVPMLAAVVWFVAEALRRRRATYDLKTDQMLLDAHLEKLASQVHHLEACNDAQRQTIDEQRARIKGLLKELQ